MKPFNALSLSPEMLENLSKLEYRSMTPIQEISIPPIIKKKDILALAKTGSGKTAAFSIGILENLDIKRFRVQSLILCPTRELADQVSKEVRRIARFRHNIKVVTITGGIPHYKQEHSLSHQAHIVVGTPGRVHMLLRRGSLVLDELKSVVLDEADRMLDMGFIDEIHDIFDFVPEKRQVLCFSATFPEEIRALSRKLQDNPGEIEVESRGEDIAITQKFYRTERGDKGRAVLQILQLHQPESVLIFCNTKEACRKVSRELQDSGLSCLALHGDLEQKDRTEVLTLFSNGSVRILIATDVAARGLDIKELAAVINYDMPFETENYIHRIGRTGRAGLTGLAFSFLKGKEQFRLDLINNILENRFSMEELPQSTGQSRPYPPAAMVTLSINGGRKNKISPGDLLGALTADGTVSGKVIGKIDRQDYITFVAVESESADKARHLLENGLIKGRQFKVRRHN